MANDVITRINPNATTKQGDGVVYFSRVTPSGNATSRITSPGSVVVSSGTITTVSNKYNNRFDDLNYG